MKKVRSKKIAISIPADVFKAAERERRSRRQTRSEFFREAVERVLREERHRRDVERYVQSYRDHPETPDETDWIDAASMEVLRESPWEE